MILRIAQSNDLDSLLFIHKDTIGSSWSKTDFASAIAGKNNKIVFSVVEKEEIIGYIMVGILPPEAEIINIAIIPNKQRKGYGSKAMELMFLELISRKVKIVFLEVREKSTAVNYYLKNGFEAVGIRKQYYPDGENALRMQKEL